MDESLVDEILDRLAEARRRRDSLNAHHPEYEIQRTIADGRVHNLERASTECTSRNDAYWQSEETLKTLQDRDEMEELKRGMQPRPQSSDAMLPPSNGFASYAGSNLNAFGGHFASDGVMAGQGRTASAPQWGLETHVDHPNDSATPYSASSAEQPSSASLSSPDSTFTRPQKRRRGSVGSTSMRTDHKSKIARPTASPPLTGNTTPTSPDSFDLPDDVPEEMYALFGGDPRKAAQELRESMQEQQAYERMVAIRREQERMDEEYAMSLQNDEDATTHTGSSFGARPGSYSTQTYFDPQGAYNHLPLASSPPPLPLEDPFATGSGSGSGSGAPWNNLQYNTLRAPIKTEPQNNSRASNSHIPQSSAEYITIDDDDDDDDDDDEDLIGLMSPASNNLNSDVVEVDPYTWQPVGQQFGHSHSENRASSSSNNGICGMAQNIFNGTVGFGRDVFSTLSGVTDNLVYGSNAASSSSLLAESNYDTNVLLGNGFLGRGLGHDVKQNLDPEAQRLQDLQRVRYEYLVNDPTKTAGQIKELLENIRPDEDLPPENREGTPDAMTYPLMEHQKLGLAWMKRMEEGSNKGGILADGMGLGKTIQALALMASRRSSNPRRKTTLIVAPVALLKQWEREIQKKLKQTKEHKMSVFILHGSHRYTPWEKLSTFDIVLTTFGSLSTEAALQDRIIKKKRENPNWRPTSKNDNLCLLGDNCYWYRIIVDEAQCIKNKNTRVAVGACRLKAETRFCMTGTPMMNNVGELGSLIQFLKIKPYSEDRKFNTDIGKPLKSQHAKTRDKAMRQLQALLKSMMLRRTKKSEIDGKPILNLKERTTESQHAPFNEDQNAFYRALENRTQLQFNRYLRLGSVGRNYSNILVLLLRLRQACCHPHLIRDFGQAGGVGDVTDDQMLDLAKQLTPDVISRIKDQAAPSDYTSLECPVCMDMADNATIFIPCGHDTCSECFARITDPTSAIAEGDFGERNQETKCPNCRGQITPSKIIDFNTFKKVHMPELCQDKEGGEADERNQDDSDREDDSDSDSDSDDESSKEEIDSKGNLKNFIVDDDAEETTKDEDDSGEDTESKAKQAIKASQGKNKDKSRDKGKGKAKPKVKKTAKTLSELKRQAGSSAKARQKYLRKLAKDWVSSSKVDRVLEILQEIRDRVDPTTSQCEKTIIFSQFTSLLDLLEVPINREGWDYRRYDGIMSPKARNDAVIDFTDRQECRIMLVSLKAGNAGLNLVAASQVIIMDPFWNPYIEEQAIDRAHRIGQQRPVKVHRILVPNTVEDRILALQEKKRTLIENALDENASKSIGRLGVKDLAFLFVSLGTVGKYILRLTWTGCSSVKSTTSGHRLLLRAHSPSGAPRSATTGIIPPSHTLWLRAFPPYSSGLSSRSPSCENINFFAQRTTFLSNSTT